MNPNIHLCDYLKEVADSNKPTGESNISDEDNRANYVRHGTTATFYVKGTIKEMSAVALLDGLNTIQGFFRDNDGVFCFAEYQSGQWIYCMHVGSVEMTFPLHQNDVRVFLPMSDEREEMRETAHSSGPIFLDGLGQPARYVQLASCRDWLSASWVRLFPGGPYGWQIDSN